MFKVEVLAPISTTHIQIRAIAAENRMPSMPIRSLAGCITNTSSRSPARDSIFADHRRSYTAHMSIADTRLFGRRGKRRLRKYLAPRRRAPPYIHNFDDAGLGHRAHYAGQRSAFIADGEHPKQRQCSRPARVSVPVLVCATLSPCGRTRTHGASYLATPASAAIVFIFFICARSVGRVAVANAFASAS